MSHRSPSPVSTPSLVNTPSPVGTPGPVTPQSPVCSLDGIPGPVTPQSLVCALDGIDSSLKLQGLPEERVPEPPKPVSTPGQATIVPEPILWPEENFALSAGDGGGFYPMRLGETFDDGRFVVTKKLGWGGFSSVWLAKDRKYVSKADGVLLANDLSESTEKIAMLPSRSYHPPHRGNLKRDCWVNATSSERSQTQHHFIPDFSTWFTSWTSSRSRVPLADTFVSS